MPLVSKELFESMELDEQISTIADELRAGTKPSDLPDFMKPVFDAHKDEIGGLIGDLYDFDNLGSE